MSRIVPCHPIIRLIRDSDIEDDVDDHPRVAHLRDHRKIDLRNSFREVVVSQILIVFGSCQGPNEQEE